MNRDNRLRFGSNCGFNPIRIQIESIALAVDEYRLGFKIENHLRGGGESHGWNNYFIAFANSYGIQCDVQSRGSGVHRNGVLAAHILGKILLEALNLSAGGQPPRFQSLDHRPDLIWTDRRDMKWNEFAV